MNTEEARSVLKDKLSSYRSLPYSDLADRVDQSDAEEIPRRHGGIWQVQIQFLWDGAPGEAVRVMGAIDDGGQSAYVPLCESFIKAADGSFMGE